MSIMMIHVSHEINAFIHQPFTSITTFSKIKSQSYSFDKKALYSKNSYENDMNVEASKNDLDILSKQFQKGLTSTILFFSLLMNISPTSTSTSTSTSTLTNEKPQQLYNVEMPVPTFYDIRYFHPPNANANSYGSLTDEQKAVAEAWRIVDNTFLDRTFNHQDWFQMREKLVKTKYKNMNEARDTIATMISSLGDKYTRYLPPDKYQSIVNSATGTLAGIGVEIGQTSSKASDGTGVPQRVQANDVEENSPAKKGGIQPLDVFIEVDGVNVEKATPDEVAQLVRGPIGSKVGVVMERNGKVYDFIVTRDKITVTSVKSYLSDTKGPNGGKVGVIRIKSFSGTTSSTVTDAIAELKKKGATSFVVDLRNNPGGLLPGGVDTASLFLEENKPVVFVVDKKGIVDSQSTLTNGMELDSPIVVFVNDQTASASEVFTAALQENKRATIVGDESDYTFGKGIVQTIRELSDGNGGVAVTIARYETPLHNDINKKGIHVDVKVNSCTNTDAVSCIPSTAFNKPQ